MVFSLILHSGIMPKKLSVSNIHQLYYTAYSAFIGRELRRQSCVCLYVIINLALYYTLLFGVNKVSL